MQADNNIDDPFASLGAQQLAAWTLRLASDDSFWQLLSYDPHLFAMLYASCAAAVEPPLRLRFGDAADPAWAGEEFLATLKDLQRQFGSSASGQFARLYLRGTARPRTTSRWALECGVPRTACRASLSATVPPPPANGSRSSVEGCVSRNQRNLGISYTFPPGNRNGLRRTGVTDVILGTVEGTADGASH